MKRHHCIMCVAATAIFLLLCATALGIEASRVYLTPNPESNVVEQPTSESNSAATYTGVIRIFVTDSDLWEDNNGVLFHHAVVGIPVQQSINLNDGDSLMWDLNFSFYSLKEENTTVVAAVYTTDGYQGYSDPPGGLPFIVHEVDASAAADCGRTGYNIAAAGFTHTVLVEEGSTTW